MKDYLLEIPSEHRESVTFLSESKGVSARISFNHTCGHVSFFTIGNLIKRKNLNLCKKCLRKSSGNVYLNKIPKKYHKYIKFLTDNRGQSAKIKYTNCKCGHVSYTTLQVISQRKNFDLCSKCSLKKPKGNAEIFLNRIPNEYHKFIERPENSGRDTKIIYTNPGCGHISKITLGSLSQRKNLDLCSSCSTSKSCAERNKKEIQEYLSRIPKKYHKYIKTNSEFIGHKTKITYTNPLCCHVIDTKLGHLIVRKQFDKCHSCNQKDVKPLTLSKERIVSFFDNYLYGAEIISGYPGNRTTMIKGLCKKCNSLVSGVYFNLQKYYNYYKKQQCQSCAPKNITQLNIYDFVKKYCEDASYNNIETVKFDCNRFKELDIYCQSKNLAIEYNGLIWHSDKYKNDKQYHWKKTKACKDLGITLLHIWGDRWLKKPEIYKSIIKTKLGVIDNKIFARKTEIKELTKSELKEFFGKNHLDGHVGCITGWGLFYSDKLVQAISVRRVNKQNKKYSNYLEIARSSTLIDHLIVGGESKLLSKVEEYAVQNDFSGILNYVSCDFGGFPKEKWKFKYQGITGISYFYTDTYKRFSRQIFQPKNGKTEKELVEEVGLLRVDGTPNLIYTMEI